MKGRSAVLERNNRQESVYLDPEEVELRDNLLKEYPWFSKSLLTRAAMRYFAEKVKLHGLDPKTLRPNDHPMEPSRKRP